jgi:release factor glutamine methyltransferase
MTSASDECGSSFVPTLSTEQIDEIRYWHDRAYAEATADSRVEQTFDYLGFNIVVPPQVHPINPMSHLLGEAVRADVRPGEHVLDMGTGSGVNAILAASNGAQVLAVDINPSAIEAAKANVVRNGVSARVDVRYSDVFSDVGERFDLIIFDPPFRWFRPRDWVEAAMADEGYQALTRFIRQARQHLSDGGRILLSFGTSGDIGYLKALLSEEGFVAVVVASDDLVRKGWKVEYFTFRVS